MSKTRRLVFLILLIWLASAFFAWKMLSLPQPLVGGRQDAGYLSKNDWHLERPDLGPSLSSLENLPLWGVARNGNVLPPPAPKEEPKPIVWKIIAAIVRPDERYVLVSIEREPVPKNVREGEELPNGGKLLRVEPQKITYRDADGTQQTYLLNF